MPERTMASLTTPAGLSTGGRALWKAITGEHPDLDASQLVQLTEACRAKDRLDKLDATLRGEPDVWVKLYPDLNSDGLVYELRVTNALVNANATANLMKQLLAAMLPDAAGRRPQQQAGLAAHAAHRRLAAGVAEGVKPGPRPGAKSG